MHTNNTPSASLAEMLSLSEGDGGTPSSVGSLGNLAEYQLATPSSRNIRPQDWEEWQKAMRCPASPKKRKVDQEDDMRIHENVFVQMLEDMMKRVLGASAAPVPAAVSLDHAQAIRSEMRDNVRKVKIELMQLVNTVMEKLQAEATSRVDAMLQTVV